MYKYILEAAGNINWMAILALLTFIFVFLLSVYTIFIRGKEYSNKMAQMPLDEK